MCGPCTPCTTHEGRCTTGRARVALGAALLAIASTGCLTSKLDTSNLEDAGLPDLDAAFAIEAGAADAVADVPAPDGGADAALDATATGGREAGATTQAGLVAGAVVSRSPSFIAVTTTGAATAPVLASPHFRFVGGVSATSSNPGP